MFWSYTYKLLRSKVSDQDHITHKIININGKVWHIPATEDRAESRESVRVRKIISFEECFRHELVAEFREIVAGPDSEDPFYLSALA